MSAVFRQTFKVEVIWTEEPGDSISGWEQDIRQVFGEVALVTIESDTREQLVPKNQ